MCKAMFVMAVLSGVVVLAERTDEEVAKKAKKVMDEYCVEGNPMDAEQLEIGKETLQNSIGEENIILESARNSADQNEFQTKLLEKSQDHMVGQAWPLSAALIVFFLFIFFMYGWCCQLCRPCKSIRSKFTAYISGCFLLIVSVALLVGLAGSLRGVSISNEGFDNVNCASASLLYEGLEGSGQPNGFIGFRVGLTRINTMIRSLEDNSTFVIEIQRLTNETENISDTAGAANESLQDASSSGCACSNHLQEQFDKTKGQAYADLRRELIITLGPEKRKALTAILKSAHSAIKLLKDMLISSVGPIVKADANVFEPFQWLSSLVFIVFWCGVAAVFFGTIGIASMLIKGRRLTPRTTYCSCCSWCLAMWFAMICFVFAFVLVGVSSYLAPLCEIMDDLDGAMLKDIGPAFGVKSSEDMDLGVAADKCLNPKNSSLNFNLLDLPSARDIEIPGSTSKDVGIIGVLQEEFTGPLETRLEAINGSTVRFDDSFSPPSTSSPSTSSAPIDCNALCLIAQEKLILTQTTADESAAVMNEIRKSVKENFIDPLTDIMQNLTCGWLVIIWQRMIDSLCYQGIYGLLRIGHTYLITAFVYLLLGLTMYVVWCVMKNNVTDWLSQKGGPASE